MRRLLGSTLFIVSSSMGSASLLWVKSVAPACGFTVFNREVFVKQFLAET